MPRQPIHTPQPRRSRPDVLDDEREAVTPRRPPPTDDAEAAAEMGRAVLVEFLAAGGVEYGIGKVAAWDYRIEALERGARALATAQIHHEEAAQLREQAAKERHARLLELLASQGTAIGNAASSALVHARASSPDLESRRAPGAVVVARSTFPAALATAVRSKTAAGVVLGVALALFALAEQLGWFQP